MFKNKTIEEFKNDLKSEAAVPGGGAVAALCSSLACALASMVGRLTQDKKGYEEVSEQVKGIIVEYDRHAAEFLDLIDEDGGSFQKVLDAFAMPKSTDEEKAARTAAIQNGLKYAAEVPLKVAEKANSLFDTFIFLAEKGNQNAKSDILVGAMLARTSVLSALLNVKINLASIKDQAYVAEMTKRVDAIEKHALDKEAAILSNVTF